jgi:hypothetical protein
MRALASAICPGQRGSEQRGSECHPKNEMRVKSRGVLLGGSGESIYVSRSFLLFVSRSEH